MLRVGKIQLRFSDKLLLCIAILVTATLSFTQPAAAWDETFSKNLATTILGMGCSDVSTFATTTDLATNMLKSIPDSATPSQIGMTGADWEQNSPALDQIKGDPGIIGTASARSTTQCADLAKLLRYGNSLSQGSTSTPQTNSNQWLAKLQSQIDPLKSGWIDTICKDSLDTGCRTQAETTIAQLANACSVVDEKNASTTTIKSYDDLKNCGMKNEDYKKALASSCSSTQTWDDATNTCVDKPSTATCSVSGVGWFVCPVSNFLSGLADGAMGILSKSFEIQAQKLFDTSSSNQAYVAWQQVRNYANIVFVIAFLIIIFSQITSIGVTNYGIKKLLPKLIVTAILVNVSFPICALLVDLSNLLGYGLATFLGSSITVTSQTSSDPLSSGNTFTGIISALLIGAAAGAFAIFSLAAVIGVILSVVVIGVTMVVLLGVRQALVVLLIVLAPLAFVAMLLPNTQPLFKKWFKMLKSMLLIFPVASLLYGGGTLARNVLYATSSSDIVKALAASLPVIALVGVYKLFMSSMTSLDNIGGALGNLRNGIGRGGKALRGASDKAIENSSYGQFGKYREREASRRRAMIQGGTYAGRGGKLNPRNWGSSAHKAFNSSGLSGNFGNIQAASGAAVVSAQDKEYLENAGARLDGFQYKDSSTGNTMTLSQNQMMDMALGNDVKDSAGRTIVGSREIDEHMQRAAIQRAAKIATVEQAETLATATSNSKMSASVRKTISESLAGSGTLARAPHLSGKALGQMQDGSFDLTQAALDTVRAGKVKPESLVAMDDTAAKTIFKAVNDTTPGSNERKLLKAAAQAVYSSSQLSDKIVAGSGLEKQLKDMTSL